MTERDPLSRARDLLFAAGRIAVDAAPVLAALTRASSPVAWVAAAGFVALKLHGEVRQAKHSPWASLPYPTIYALLGFARRLGIGSVTSRFQGGDERVHRSACAAARSRAWPGSWSAGPRGARIGRWPASDR